MIVAVDGTPTALAARAASPTIPIVFIVGADPVELGFAASLARPGGNMTGVGLPQCRHSRKAPSIVHELVPATREIAFIRNPTNPYYARSKLENWGSGWLFLDCAYCFSMQAIQARLKRRSRT